MLALKKFEGFVGLLGRFGCLSKVKRNKMQKNFPQHLFFQFQIPSTP